MSDRHNPAGPPHSSTTATSSTARTSTPGGSGLSAAEGVLATTGFRTPEDGLNGHDLYNVKSSAGDKPANGPAFGGTPTLINNGGDSLLGRAASAGAPTAEAWQDGVMPMLMARTGGLCEARTPDCLAEPYGGRLAGLSRRQVSIHHRQPRKMGGTRRWDVWVDDVGWVEQLPGLHEIVLICGTGTVGCHGWVESNRELSEMLGWLIPAAQPGQPLTGITDPARVVLVLPGKSRVLLSPYGGYLPAPDGWRWAA